MEEVFLKILNMSIAACWIILAVIAARFLLKKAPKWIVVAMWGIAGLRLVCPFTIESVLSLIPSAETVPNEILYTDEPVIHTGVPFVNDMVNPVIHETLAPAVENVVKPAQSAASVAAIVWVVGVGLMLAYMAFSYIRVYIQVREAAFRKDNVWVCDAVDTPFVLGVFRPRIYLPSAMSEEDMGYVVAHERAHLKRRDHWWKPAGFLILAVHWFNPLVWLAYILLCRDIEFACDEKVIKALSVADRKAYSNALINCSAPRRVISACPLAFGENGVKSRIKSVLNYKKPAFWIILAAIIACIVVAVCFLTNPKTKPGNDGDNSTGVVANEPQEFTQAFDKLSITLTTDKTEYVLGEDKIAEVTATVKNTSSETLWLHCANTGKNIMLPTSLRLPNSEIELIDLDSSYVVQPAEDEVKLDPGEEYVQKMRFDLTREGLHPGTGEPLVPAKPGVYQGDCAAIYAFDQYTTEVSDLKSNDLDFQILLKERNTGEFVNSAQKFTQVFDKLSMTLTTDKTEYVLGEDKIAEVTATVKNTSGEKLWLYSGYTGGKNFMLRPTLELPGSGISLLDLDYFPAIDCAIEKKLLDPGEEFVQKMRFDLTGEGLHPLMKDTLLPPVEPGEYQGKCEALFLTDPDSWDLEGCSLDFKIVVKPSPSAVLINDQQKFTRAFDKFSVTVTSDKAKYVIGEDKIARVTAVVKNTSDKSIFLYHGDLGQNHMIRTSLKHWISEMDLIDLDCAEIVADAVNEIELKPGEEYTQVMRFDLARDQFVSSLTGEKLSLPPAEAGWYFGTCRVTYLKNNDHTWWDSIDFRIALVNDINDSPGNINASAHDKTISEDDVKAVRANYNDGDKPLYDAKVVDLGFNGREEVLVLTSQGNPKVFEVWDKRGGEMKFVTSFGAGKLNWIDKISLLHCIDANERSRYVFSFAYGGENSMTADEVLAEIVRTEDGYDVEYLLSRGRIEYTDVPEPFTKEFYRVGWSKYDIGMNDNKSDITKEDYIELYKDFTGITPNL